MGPLEVDGERLRREVRKFEALEGERAAQQALADYLAASQALRREEQEMNAKMESALDAYESTDGGVAGGLDAQMGI